MTDNYFIYKLSPLMPLDQIKPNFVGWSLCCPISKISDRLPSKMVTTTKYRVTKTLIFYLAIADVLNVASSL